MDIITDFLDELALPVTLAGDLSLLLLFIGASLGIGFFLGRSKLVTILIDIYIARALLAILPGEWLEFSLYGEAIVFGGLFLLLFFMDKRLFDLHISNAGADFFWRILVMGILVTGLLVSSFLYFLPRAVALDWISLTAYGYFASPLALTLWISAPILVLFFINNRLK